MLMLLKYFHTQKVARLSLPRLPAENCGVGVRKLRGFVWATSSMHLHFGWSAVVHGKEVEKSWRALTLFS